MNHCLNLVSCSFIFEGCNRFRDGSDFYGGFVWLLWLLYEAGSIFEILLSTSRTLRDLGDQNPYSDPSKALPIVSIVVPFWG